MSDQNHYLNIFQSKENPIRFSDVEFHLRNKRSAAITFKLKQILIAVCGQNWLFKPLK